jgi:hypothetical protein
VPRGDVDRLRERVEQLLSSPALRMRLGANGRARYEQRFTLDHLVAKTLAVYQDVLAGRNGEMPTPPQSPTRARSESASSTSGTAADELHVRG